MPQTVKLTIGKDGKVVTDWWTKKTGDFLCSLCQKCKGWDSGEKPMECVMGNPWCG